jgi:23S rRNA (cytosine1962-C5)-methyltransferase
LVFSFSVYRFSLIQLPEIIEDSGVNWHKVFAKVPPISQRRIAIHVKPAAERALRQGHPWLFEEGIKRQSFEGNAGDLAVVFDRQDKFLAIGLYDPASVIRVRVLQHHQSATINAEWFANRVRDAVAIRQPLLETDTNGYRLIYGENDRFPGLVVDRYAETLVVKVYSVAWWPHLAQVLDQLVQLQPCERVVLRMSRNLQQSETFGLYDGQVILGDALSDDVLFRENGLQFSASVIDGHKTGFFFDQRDSRARVRQLAAGCQAMLDVFAYTGGFSVYAAAGGARRVVSLDISRPALREAQRNMSLNRDIAGVEHEIIVGDAFKELTRLYRSNRQFDLVVIDPPSFAKQQTEVEKALAAYRDLAELGVDLVRAGGVLMLGSCSSRVSAEVFYSTVLNQLQGRVQMIDQNEHGLDHPVKFPEGAYLKNLYMRVI